MQRFSYHCSFETLSTLHVSFNDLYPDETRTRKTALISFKRFFFMCTIFKSSLNLLQYCFCFMSWFLATKHVGS